MKKVTTNMTFSQVLFILFILIVASLMFFYLGAKFGSDVLTLADHQEKETLEPFLPDAKLAQEIQTLLASREQKLLFHDVVQGKKSMNDIRPQTDKNVMTHKPATVVRSEAELKAEQAKLLKSETSHAKSPEDPVVASLDKKQDAQKGADSKQTASLDSKSVGTENSVKATETKKPALAVATDQQPQTVIAPRPVDETAKKVLLPGMATSTPTQPKPAVLPTRLAEPGPKVVTAATPPTAAKTNLPNATVNASDQDVLKTALQTTPAVDSAKVYRLQLGSYAQKNRALQAKAEWESRGYAVNLVETSIPGKGQWYRLQLGRYTSLPEVQSAQRKIMQQFQQTAMILTVSGQ